MVCFKEKVVGFCQICWHIISIWHGTGRRSKWSPRTVRCRVFTRYARCTGELITGFQLMLQLRYITL